MTIIRTDRTAIATGAVLVGLTLLTCDITGLGVPARGRISFDAQIVTIIIAAIGYGTAFVLGHAVLRSRETQHRAAYAGVGALSATLPFVFITGHRGLAGALSQGALAGALLVPLIIGGLAGFLYHRRAGYDEVDDDGCTDAELFYGPIVVRTSPGALAVASFASSAFLMIAISISIGATGGFVGPVPAVMKGPGMGLPQAIVGGAMMAALPIFITHRVLRALQRHSYRSYLKGALAGPGSIALLTLPASGIMAAFVFFTFTIPAVIGMMTYRKLAGLEPAPLPEPVEVSNRRTLATADHPARRAPAIVATSRPGAAFGRARRG